MIELLEDAKKYGWVRTRATEPEPRRRYKSKAGATARMLGVSDKTIRNDTADNSAPKVFIPIEYEDVIEATADNSAPAPGWIE